MKLRVAVAGDWNRYSSATAGSHDTPMISAGMFDALCTEKSLYMAENQGTVLGSLVSRRIGDVAWLQYPWIRKHPEHGLLGAEMIGLALKKAETDGCTAVSMLADCSRPEWIRIMSGSGFQVNGAMSVFVAGSGIRPENWDNFGRTIDGSDYLGREYLEKGGLANIGGGDQLILGNDVIIRLSNEDPVPGRAATIMESGKTGLSGLVRFLQSYGTAWSPRDGNPWSGMVLGCHAAIAGELGMAGARFVSQVLRMDGTMHRDEK